MIVVGRRVDNVNNPRHRCGLGFSFNFRVVQAAVTCCGISIVSRSLACFCWHPNSPMEQRRMRANINFFNTLHLPSYCRVRHSHTIQRMWIMCWCFSSQQKRQQGTCPCCLSLLINRHVSGYAVWDFVVRTASCFICFGCPDEDNWIIIACWLSVDEPLRTACG